MAFRTLSIAALIGLAGPFAVSAQAVISIGGPPACDSCTFRFTRLARLGGDTEQEGLISLASIVVRNSKGDYYVAPTYAGGLVVKYSPSGASIAVLGGAGGGPGEHRGIQEITLSANDSLYVFEEGNGRISVWGPDDRFVRVARLPAYPFEARALPDGRIILQSRATAIPGAKGAPIHLLDVSGNVIRSFGRANGDGPAITSTYDQWRAIALGPGETVWSGHYNRYEIELWSLTGEHIGTIVRRLPGFHPYIRMTVPPQPVLRALTQDEAGRLWVLITIADPEGWESDQPHRNFNTLIEVIDPTEARVVASCLHPKLIERFVAPGILPIIEQKDDGGLVVDVWKVDLQGLPTTPDKDSRSNSAISLSRGEDQCINSS
ncbi:MAG: hypothetical protein P8099_10840 [Gemmatimonadota bacterium]|jgi:hypothetical protein